MFEQLKVRAVCDELDIDERHARLYVHIHNLAEIGFQTEESYESSRGQQIRSTLRSIVPSDGSVGITEQIEDLRRMFSDPLYRQMHFDKYINKILPEVKAMGLKRFILALGKDSD